MEDTATTPTHQMVLQLATERQVHAFDLSDTFRVSVGRHHTNDVQLRSNRVSNYHAEILNEVDGLMLRDMGSTNGTYINDESVRLQRIKTGDRIRIGNFQITVRLIPRGRVASEIANPFSVGTIGNILPFQRNVSATHLTVSRDRLDTTLPELLLELASHNTTAMVLIRNQNEVGRIYVDSGQIVHCEKGAVRKAKALHRVLAQQKGRYEILEFPTDASVPTTIAGETELIVLEAMQQIEALERLTSQLPPMVYEIVLDEDCSKPINMLSPDEIETYQYLVRYETIVKVMEESPFTDFTVLRLIHGLLARGFFRASRASGGLLEETSFSRPEAS